VGLSPQVTGESTPPSFNRAPARSGKTFVDFFEFLFCELDNAGVRYCILHSWDRLPQRPESDVDIAVHPEDRAKLAGIYTQMEQEGYLPVQCLNYSVNAFYFVFSWFDEFDLRTVAIDLIFQNWRSGLTVPDVAALVGTRTRFQNTWIPSPRDQFAYSLAKQTWKGKANDVQSARLIGLAQQLGKTEVSEIAGEMFLKPWNGLVVEACFKGSIRDLLKDVRLLPWLTSLVRQPFALLRHILLQGKRILSRWVRPAGMLVAIIGPDGAGKDTVIGGLCDGIHSSFRRIDKYHWRPHVLFPRRDAPAVTDPHAKSARGPISSSLFLMGFVLDYWIGYALRVRPALARGTLVIFDRYFYDVMVDPKRARFGGPKWLPGMLARFVPLPDLILLLDADERAMFARKRELSEPELKRQRQAYRSMSVGIGRRKIISTDREIRQSIQDAQAEVLQFLHGRFAVRHADWICRRQEAAQSLQGATR
jgi:thymidylate kinase